MPTGMQRDSVAKTSLEQLTSTLAPEHPPPLQAQGPTAWDPKAGHIPPPKDAGLLMFRVWPIHLLQGALSSVLLSLSYTMGLNIGAQQNGFPAFAWEEQVALWLQRTEQTGADV